MKQEKIIIPVYLIIIVMNLLIVLFAFLYVSDQEKKGEKELTDKMDKEFNGNKEISTYYISPINEFNGYFHHPEPQEGYTDLEGNNIKAISGDYTSLIQPSANVVIYDKLENGYNLYIYSFAGIGVRKKEVWEPDDFEYWKQSGYFFFKNVINNFIEKNTVKIVDKVQLPDAGEISTNGYAEIFINRADAMSKGKTTYSNDEFVTWSYVTVYVKKIKERKEHLYFQWLIFSAIGIILSWLFFFIIKNRKRISFS